MFYFKIATLFCGIASFDLTLFKLWGLKKSPKPQYMGLFTIWLFGLLAFLVGWLGSVMGMIDAFDAIQVAGDISPSLVAGGMQGAITNTQYGLQVLIFSVIFWGIAKAFKNHRIKQVQALG